MSPPIELQFDNQYAFRPTGSTTAALISLFHTIADMLDNCSFVRVIALDFSKAFDTVRHSQLISKFQQLPIPDNISNCVSDFLTERNHCTHFQGEISSPKYINSSIVQGSALGPAAFTIVSSDLKTCSALNRFVKFADDTYLAIPGTNIQTTDEELDNIDKFAAANNLYLNRPKSKEMLLFKSKSKSTSRDEIPFIPGIERVSELKCLGVTINSNFSFSSHIGQTISACSSNLYALHILRSKGLPSELLSRVFISTSLSKLLYASQFWWGFTTAQDKQRLEAFLKRARKVNFYDQNLTFAELCSVADSKLFNNIVSNPQHMLANLLPPQNKHTYSTRMNASSRTYQIDTKRSGLSDRNFITRMVLSDTIKY